MPSKQEQIQTEQQKITEIETKINRLRTELHNHKQNLKDLNAGNLIKTKGLTMQDTTEFLTEKLKPYGTAVMCEAKGYYTLYLQNGQTKHIVVKSSKDYIKMNTATKYDRKNFKLRGWHILLKDRYETDLQDTDLFVFLVGNRNEVEPTIFVLTPREIKNLTKIDNDHHPRTSKSPAGYIYYFGLDKDNRPFENRTDRHDPIYLDPKVVNNWELLAN